MVDFVKKNLVDYETLMKNEFMEQRYFDDFKRLAEKHHHKYFCILEEIVDEVEVSAVLFNFSNISRVSKKIAILKMGCNNSVRATTFKW